MTILRADSTDADTETDEPEDEWSGVILRGKDKQGGYIYVCVCVKEQSEVELNKWNAFFYIYVDLHIYVCFLSTVVDKELKTGDTDRENHLNISEKDVFLYYEN